MIGVVINKEKIEDNGVAENKKNQYTCVCCRIKFETGELQRNHFKTEWHLYNLKRKVCHLNPIDLPSFQEIQAAAPKPSALKVKAEPKSQTSTIRNEENDDDWEDEDEEFLDEEFLDEEAKEMLSRVIKSNACLFCEHKSANMVRNLTHMNTVHGFFIPEDQHLIDLDGLMEYLGFKVGAGATCLWCDKQFTTVHGVRLHMIYKDHCKIFYNQDKAVDEFKEFYDYSTQEVIKMKPLDQIAIPKKLSMMRAEHDRALAKTRATTSDSKQLVAKKGLAMMAGSYQAKNIKKFDAYRAKILLRTGMANNQTMRGRLRQQNPI